MQFVHIQRGLLPKSITCHTLEPISREVMQGTFQNSLIKAQVVLGVDNKNCLASPHMFWIFKDLVTIKTSPPPKKKDLVLGSITRKVFHLQEFPVGIRFKSHKGQGQIFVSQCGIPDSCPSNSSHWGKEKFAQIFAVAPGGCHPLYLYSQPLLYATVGLLKSLRAAQDTD